MVVTISTAMPSRHRFYGDARDLEVIYNEGTNGWSEPKTLAHRGRTVERECAGAGDLNGMAGRLVLLGDNGSLYFLPQLADHTLGEPQKIPCSGTPKSVQIVDVDGDGRNDLLLWTGQPTPLRFRLQNAPASSGRNLFQNPAPALVLRG